jgi:O-antigen ligase
LISARRTPPDRAAAAGLALMLLTAAGLFGGVYLWAALPLALAAVTLAFIVRLRFARAGTLRALDVSLATLLCAVLLQIVPLPAAVVRAVSPAREAFRAATALQQAGQGGMAPLTLDVPATLHAWISLVSIVTTFWIARTLFSRGGIRTFSMVIAWGAIVFVLIAFAQQASGTTLVYGFWQPRDLGARPLGPFINRNHFGTWSLLAICLCAGYLQWRSDRFQAGGSWRARVASWLDGRGVTLHLAVALLAAAIAWSASRSSLVALACAAGYVALAAPAGPQGQRRRLPLAILAAIAIVAMLGYGDGRQLLLRMDETRTVGMANRIAIWRDGLAAARDFPLAGVGAGSFSTAMRVYQTSPRTYYHNEAHNQYLQLVVEGGLLLVAPATVALLAFVATAWRQLRRPDDPLQWMRVAAAGALIGVAVQSIWETGLTIPANGMFAAALAGLLVHTATHSPYSSLAHGERR